MAEEEVRAEVEAVEAVYGDDCQVIKAFPPHLRVHLKPRTADVSSQQFVEAIIEMRAGPQYPEEPPDISVSDSKGLDEQRQKHLISSILAKAFELASCLMLVALCEEAVERLSSMNHPDGDCPLCLYPLLDKDAGSNSQPFMKLMSCFHCFHCDCIIRWWNWIQMQSKEMSSSSSNSCTHNVVGESMGQCPVCRKVFLAKDIEHVLDLVGSGAYLDSIELKIDQGVLQSDSENIRRQKFEAILKLQQENSGLIEPKNNEVLLPGVYLPHPAELVPNESTTTSSGPQNKDIVAKSGSSSGISLNRPGFRKHNSFNMRRHRTQNSRNQVRHWIRKDDVSQT